MRRAGLLLMGVLTALLALFAVRNDHKSTKEQPGGAEMRISTEGRISRDEIPQMRFSIGQVYEQQMLTTAAPWHERGGEWTFFDCSTDGESPAKFTIGVHAKAQATAPVKWGEAVILCPDRTQGRRFVQMMAAAFGQGVPTERSPAPLVAKPFHTAILGENYGRDVAKSFVEGKQGGWTATKWFLQFDGREAEVYFNYDLAGRRGEFSEKDAGYNEDLVWQLALLLRDGPRIPRTPQTDPNMSEVGPKLADIQKVPAFVRGSAAFTPNGNRIMFATSKHAGPSLLHVAPVDDPGRATEVATVDRYLARFVCANGDGSSAVLEETIPQQAGAISSTDPTRLWWLAGEGKAKQELQGPWGAQGTLSGDKPVSPDGRYVLIRYYVKSERPPYRGITMALDLKTRNAVPLSVPESDSQFAWEIGWTTASSGVRAVFRVTDDHTHAVQFWLADPVTGQDNGADGLSPTLDPTVSPDGKQRAQVRTKDNLVITDLATGQTRSFVFHEDDRPFVSEGCVTWCSARYLRFTSSRLAFINAATLKMSYASAEEEEQRVELSPDFGHALLCGDNELRIAAIVIR